MKMTNYLKDKLYILILCLCTYIILLLLYIAMKVTIPLIIASSFLLLSLFVAILLIDYFRKKTFYQQLLSHVEWLDKSYLVLETIQKPQFYEGELVYQALYDINKSMIENIKIVEMQWNDFRDYIEMWIHEVKRPLSSLVLIGNNEKFDRKTMVQMKRIEAYLEQVLYYVRSEHAEKDYLIKNVELSNVIKNVALNNMNELIENKIDFIVEDINLQVLTDAKWLEFILNQIINNSVKYKRDDISSYIKISSHETQNDCQMIIEDNGIGIPSSDISRVFEKTFTGENGRTKVKSTGMGLFIVKNLCLKLGHQIDIESQIHEYTRVKITFYKNKYYDVLK